MGLDHIKIEEVYYLYLQELQEFIETQSNQTKSFVSITYDETEIRQDR